VLRCHAKDAVFIDFESPLFGNSPQHHIVIFGAGKILQGRAERLGRNHPQVDLQPALQTDGHLGVAANKDLSHTFKLFEMIHDGSGVISNNQQVQVSDGLLAAAVGAGDFELLDGLLVGKMLAKQGDDFIGLGPIDAFVGLSGQVDSSEDFFLGLLAEALEVLDEMLFAGRPQLIERGDVEFLVDGRRLFGAETGDT